MNKKIQCPVCRGTGHIEAPNLRNEDEVTAKHRIAAMLREDGYSIRQIMRFLGYKSPSAVQFILKRGN